MRVLDVTTPVSTTFGLTARQAKPLGVLREHGLESRTAA